MGVTRRWNVLGALQGASEKKRKFNDLGTRVPAQPPQPTRFDLGPSQKDCKLKIISEAARHCVTSHLTFNF